MSESLDLRLTRLRRRIRQVVWLYGLSWLIAILFGSAMVVGFIDWAVHLDDAGLRLFVGLAILASTGWVCWRRLIRPLRYQPADVDLALRIEQRYPGFNDSLASTVEFVNKGIDPAVGSAQLQRRVVQQTTEQAARLNLADVIDTRNVQRLVVIAVAVCLMLALLVGLNQVNAGIALNRLVFPFSDVNWPRTTDLRLLDADYRLLEYDPKIPLRLARGDVLTVYVQNSQGDLPDDLRMEYRTSDNQVERQTVRIASRRDADGKPREVGVATIVATSGPIWFRAVGGDDREKPLFKLEVVPPPLVQDLQVVLTPPKYTGRPTERLPHGVGHVEGLVGTTVDVTARVNKKLSTAMLRIRGSDPRKIDLSANGLRLKTRFVIAEPGVYSYWFDLQDSQGFENPEAPRYEVRAVADRPPEVQIEEPAVDQYVTPAADVPLRFLVRDDLGLSHVRLHYKLGLTQDDSTQPWLLRDGDVDVARPLELQLEEVWHLADLSLSPGMQIVFYATATDDFDLGSEHVGRSISRNLIVVTPEEKKAELASRQSELLEELERLVKAQLRAREQVGELETQLNTVGSLRPSDVDLLKRIELDQRQITSRLLNPVDGFERQAGDSLSDLQLNRIDAPQMSLRLKQIVEEVATLKQSLLPAVEQELTRARKAANAAIGSDVPDSKLRDENSADDEAELNSKPDVKQPAADSASSSAAKSISRNRFDSDEANGLANAREYQGAVLESLEVMRDQLKQWRNQHDLINDINELIAGQQSVQQDASELGRQTLGRSGLDKLTPQEEADLAKVADRQRRQAERLDEFRESLKAKAADGSRQATSASNRTAQDAEQHIKQNAIGSKMRQAADALKRNQVGIAAEGQNQVAEDLDELRSILTESSTLSSEALVKKLKQAESDLQSLRKRQDELLKKTKDAGQIDNAQQRELQLQQLSKQQQQLREEVSRLSRKLRRLTARQASASTSRATKRLRRSEEQLGESDADNAVREQQESLDDLEQAQRELVQTRREAEERLARELLERMTDKLKLMVVMQQAVIDETDRLRMAREKRRSWSRSLLSSLSRLRETQNNLRDDTLEIIDAMSAVEVIGLALEGAARSMKIASSRLEQRQTGSITVAAEEAAKRRFVELVQAMKPESTSGGPTLPGGAGGEQDERNEGIIAKLGEVKLMKTLQESLLRRTAEIDALKVKNGRLTETEQQELSAIADEQGRLADLARNMMQSVREAIELEEPSSGAQQEQDN